MLKLFDLIYELGDKFPKSFKTEFLTNEYGLGYYVKNQEGHPLLWFGCGYYFWKECGSCLIVGVGDNEHEGFSQTVIDRFQEKFGQAAIREDSEPELGPWYQAPIPDSLIEAPQNVKKIVQFIAEAAAYCDSPKIERR